MRSKNRYPGMDPAIVKQIQYHAWRLKQMPCFCSEDIEDIEQELLCEVFECLAKYNKQKSSLGTFVDQIVTRRSNNMIQRRLSLKRGGKCTTISLDVCDEYGVALVDKLPDEQSFEDLDLALDVAHIVCRLPEGTQRITTLLQTYTITEVASMTGKSRAAIYRLLEQIRPCFIELLPYLNQGGHPKLKSGIKPSTKGEPHE